MAQQRPTTDPLNVPVTHDAAVSAVPPSIRAAAAWSWRVLVIAVAGLAGLWLAWWFKTIVVPVLIAALLAALLAPTVTWMHEKVGIHRTAGAAIALLTSLGLVVALLTVAGRSVVQGFAELGQAALEGVEAALEWLATSPLAVDREQIDDLLDQLMTTIQDNSSVLASGVLSVTVSVGNIAAGTIIALFCLFFFLREGRRIWLWCVRLLPRSSRGKADRAGLRAWVTLGGYARTQILVAFIDAVGIGVGAAILGVPLALPLGVLVFIGSFVPIVGALVTGAIAVAVALVDQGFVSALIMLAIVVGVQQIEGNVLQPFLMGKVVELHPVAVLLAVSAGTISAGIIGALLAVPIAAVINTVMISLHQDEAPLGEDPVRSDADPPSKGDSSNTSASGGDVPEAAPSGAAGPA